MTRASCLLFLISLISFNVWCQDQVRDTLTKKETRLAKKAWKIENGRPLLTPILGPAYTPEMGLTIAGGGMLS